jgi:type II secretory pathway pseudopilin PulG
MQAVQQSSCRESTAAKGVRAFSLVEALAVVVVLGILAAIVVPRFGNVSDDARAAALEQAVGGVRASIAGYRTRAVIAGNPPLPSLETLTSAGEVMSGGLPENPYSGLITAQSVTVAQAQARTVLNETSYGWNYAVDNSADPPIAIFYANSDMPTTSTNGAGVILNANEF